MAVPGDYNNAQARTPEQLQKMKQLAKRGICAFCYEHIRHETIEPIELETEHWFVKKNDYPYERTKLHLMLIPKLHVHTISELAKEIQVSFLPLVTQLERQYHLTSYALGLRSGDMHYNGGSVEHLHAHLIVGDPTHPDPEPVRFKMSSRPKA